MDTQYSCQNKRRRQAIADHQTLNGIDYLEVVHKAGSIGSVWQTTLLVHCLKALTPTTVKDSNVQIEGDIGAPAVLVEWAKRASDAADLFAEGLIADDERDFLLALPDPGCVLVVRTDGDGDLSTYHLRLIRSATEPVPLEGFDNILSEIAFSFKVDCPDEFDCQVEKVCPPGAAHEPALDYLAKDFASFRTLILDRLAVVMPDWRERSPADQGVALVELLAYAGDYLSYYQDAVGSEAYLGTARRRTSVRRHARLLDYQMHDGCNARVWVHCEVAAGSVTLKQDTELLTHVAEHGGRIAPNSAAYTQALTQQPVIFATVHETTLYQAHNELEFYTWGDENCCLPKGATRATLRGDQLNLKQGDVLIFEEKRSPDSGRAADANPGHRHAVRLLADARSDFDRLGGRFLDNPTDNPVPVTEIEWLPDDALPFPLCVSQVKVPEEERAPGDPEYLPVTVVLGNIVLADHGRQIANEEIVLPSGSRRYRPRLQWKEITHRVPYDHKIAQQQPASRSLLQDPKEALPAAILTGDGTPWTPQRDLLGSDRFAAEFVVEMENDGHAYVRFGDDDCGRMPQPGEYQVSYRVGNGARGNVGADAIGHIVTNSAVEKVYNPLPAAGGTEPESLEEVRLYAPQALRKPERAVTEADYAAMAERHPEIQKAVATRRWTGSWYTMFVTVDRKRGLPVDAAFKADLRRWLERFRLAGHDLKIESPQFVPLEIVLTVCVAPGFFKSDVKRSLLDAFSNRDLPDGRQGFFHPDRFTFGQPVYLSQLIAEAMAVPGVQWVDADDKNNKLNRFRRWRHPAHGEIDAGSIGMARLEIARLDNDPSLPEHGKIDFIMLGGI